MNKILTRKRLFDLFIMTFGVMLVALSYSFFLQPNNIVIGGVSGVGVIYQNLSEIDPALLMLITNLLLLIIGLIFLGRSFFLKSIYGSLMFPVFVKIFNIVFDYLPNSFQNQITNIDLFLIVVFSSIIMGIGLGIVVKRGGTTGGTEIPQNILFKYFHISFSVSLLILDGAVILTGFLVLKSLSLALYSIIFTFICGKIMDAVIFGSFNKRAVYIISEAAEEITDKLVVALDRGITSIKVIGEYSQKEKKMLVCVLSNREYYKLRTIVEKIDKTAFYFAVQASEVRGEGFTYEPIDD